MIMSPTRPMTLPILDVYWHVNVICFFHLTALQIFTCSGSSDVTGWHGHTVLGRAEHSVAPVLYGLFCCYGWPQTSEHVREFARPFHVTRNLALITRRRDQRTAFQSNRDETGLVLPKGGSKPHCRSMEVSRSHTKASLVLIHKHLCARWDLIFPTDRST